MTEAEESERRQKEFATRTKVFMDALDVDETLAQLLASEGFGSVEELASVEVNELASIDGLDDATGEELLTRARTYLEKQAAEFEAKRKALGVTDDLAGFEGLSPAMLVVLGEAGVKSLEDFADLATDELTGWNERKNGETTKHKGYFSGMDVSAAEAEAMIMAARVQLGWIEAPVEEAPAEEETEAQA
jgi:transcription termination/antitermination protein NusA